MAACLLLLTRLGRIFDELLSNWLLEGAHNLGAEVVPAVIGAIADLFKRLMTTMERVLYGVDEWFRFRRQESSIMSAFKSVFGVIWLALSYVLRLLMVLIVEPTFNPLKHFPMVTVAGKFMVVFAAMMYEPLKQAMPAPWPAVIIFLIVFCVPGVFGFLVWELKENWRLYRANRAQTLRPVAVGHHGESVLRLLRPGFHSGTVPRTFARWRKAVRKGRAKAGFNAEHQLGHVREAIHRLMDREVLHLLARVQPVADLSLVTGRIHLGVTMIRVDLDSARHPATPLTLSFELKSGWLLARLVRSGWLDQLAAADQEVVRFAIEGLYRYAGTTLPEQRLREVVAPISTEFDVRQEKLLVWPGDDFRTRLAYPLDEASPVCPEVTPAGKPEDWLALDVAALVAGPVPIGWAEWVAFWDRHGAAREKAATPAKPELAAQPTG